MEALISATIVTDELVNGREHSQLGWYKQQNARQRLLMASKG
jgi:hypothetical protein